MEPGVQAGGTAAGWMTTVTGRVLVAEDEVRSRREVAELLRHNGFNVKVAQGGRQAIKMAAETNPAVAILDIRMPKVDGIAAAQEIQLVAPKTSILFLTAFANNVEYRRQVEEAGLRVAAWVDKPLLPERRRKLVQILKREVQKFDVRAAIEQAREHGVSPAEFRIPDLEPELVQLVDEVRDEVVRDMLPSSAGVCSVVPSASGESVVISVEEQIDGLYAQLRSLLSRSRSEPALCAEIDVRIGELRQLQEREAAELSRRYEAFLGFRPSRVLELLARAKRALGDA